MENLNLQAKRQTRDAIEKLIIEQGQTTIETENEQNQSRERTPEGGTAQKYTS